MSARKTTTGGSVAGHCPICGAPTVAESRPFCSRRCANVDLNRWLSGAYAIPVVEDEDEDGGLPEAEEPGEVGKGS